MRILPLGLLEQIKNFDPSIEVVFNHRIQRWVVVQVLPRAVPVTNELRGVPAVGDQAYSRLKFLFTCETEKPRLPSNPERGYPIEPGAWIVGFLAEKYPTRQEMIDPTAWEDRWHRQEREQEEREKKTRESYFRDAADDIKSDILKYAGIGKYSSEASPKKHIFVGDGD